MNCSQLVTIDQIAQMLTISKRQAFKLRAEGLMPEPIRIKGSVRWRLADIRAWVEAGCPAQQRDEIE